MSFFELLIKDNVLARKEESRWQKVVLVRLLFVVLLIEASLELLKVFIEHVFATKFLPASEVVNFHMG